MSFALRRNESVKKGLRRLFTKEVRSALQSLERAPLTTESVHEARVHIKKSRAVLRLIRKRERGLDSGTDRRLKSSGQSLSSLRDASAMVGTARGLCTRRDAGLTKAACDLVRGDLAEHATRLRRRDQRATRAARKWLRSISKSARHLQLKGFGTAGLKRGVKRAYARAQKEMQHARSHPGSSSSFHEWRKRVKTLSYQLRLLSARTSGFRRVAAAIKRLEQQLGREHNLQVLRDYVAARRRSSGRTRVARRLTTLAENRQQQLRKTALGAGTRAFSETPKMFLQHGFR